MIFTATSFLKNKFVCLFIDGCAGSWLLLGLFSSCGEPLSHSSWANGPQLLKTTCPRACSLLTATLQSPQKERKSGPSSSPLVPPALSSVYLRYLTSVNDLSWEQRGGRKEDRDNKNMMFEDKTEQSDLHVLYSGGKRVENNNSG